MTDRELGLIGLIALTVVVALILFHKELELTSVDPVYADVIGLRIDVVRYGLLVLLALATVAGIQAVGVVLTSAMLITPAATASLLTNRLPRMMALSTVFAIASGVIGLYALIYANYSVGRVDCPDCYRLFPARLGLANGGSGPGRCLITQSCPHKPAKHASEEQSHYDPLPQISDPIDD